MIGAVNRGDSRRPFGAKRHSYLAARNVQPGKARVESGPSRMVGEDVERRMKWVEGCRLSSPRCRMQRHRVSIVLAELIIDIYHQNKLGIL